jgi:hypothetical membrane protein
MTITTDGTKTCDQTTSVTRSLLGYGIIAGPLYVGVSLAQALTRDGFDLTRHEWSLLANGDFGWIQSTNLIVTGLMVLAFAVGLHRSLVLRRLGGGWAPRLVGGYGLGMVGAGAFRADPALGFPVGTPDGVTDVSWHGTLHFVTAGIGFACLIVACLVLARRFAAAGSRGLAVFSVVTGVAFLAGFIGVASSGGAVAMNLAFTGAIVLVWAWMSVVAVHLYRR